MGKAIAYLRVSTQQQHRSGLGIEAQRTAVGRFAEVEGIEIIREFVEAETGKGADAWTAGPSLPPHWPPPVQQMLRPRFQARRLSRDVAFVSGQMAQRVPVHRCRVWAAMPTHSCCTSTRPWRRKSAADLGMDESRIDSQEGERR